MAAVGSLFPAAVDLDGVFHGFLKGYSDIDIAVGTVRSLGLDDESLPLVYQDVVEQSRGILALERALAEPQLYATGSFPLITLRQADFDACCDAYYSLHPRVVRAVLGKILSSRVRAGLDSVIDTGTHALSSPDALRLREALRNFDCLRRVYDAVESAAAAAVAASGNAARLGGPGQGSAAGASGQGGDWSRLNLFSFLRSHFRVGPRVAWSYLCVLWLLKHRFNIAVDSTTTTTTTASSSSSSSSASSGAAKPQVVLSRWHSRATGEAFLSVASAALCCWTNGLALSGADWCHLRYDRRDWMKPLATVVTVTVPTAQQQKAQSTEASSSGEGSTPGDAVTAEHPAARSLLLQRMGSEGSLGSSLGNIAAAAAGPTEAADDGFPLSASSSPGTSSSHLAGQGRLLPDPSGGDNSNSRNEDDSGSTGGAGIIINRSLSVSSAPAGSSSSALGEGIVRRTILRRGGGASTDGVTEDNEDDHDDDIDASDRHYYHRHHTYHHHASAPLARHAHEARSPAEHAPAPAVDSQKRKSKGAGMGISFDPAFIDGLKEACKTLKRLAVDDSGNRGASLVSAVVSGLASSLKLGNVPVFVLGPRFHKRAGSHADADADATIAAMEALRSREGALVALVEASGDRMSAVFRCLRDAAASLSISISSELRELFNAVHAGVVVPLRDGMGVKSKAEASLLLAALGKAGAAALSSSPLQSPPPASGTVVTFEAGSTSAANSSASIAIVNAWLRFMAVAEVMACSLYDF